MGSTAAELGVRGRDGYPHTRKRLSRRHLNFQILSPSLLSAYDKCRVSGMPPRVRCTPTAGIPGRQGYQRWHNLHLTRPIASARTATRGCQRSEQNPSHRGARAGSPCSLAERNRGVGPTSCHQLTPSLSRRRRPTLLPHFLRSSRVGWGPVLGGVMGSLLWAIRPLRRRKSPVWPSPPGG